MAQVSTPEHFLKLVQGRGEGREGGRGGGATVIVTELKGSGMHSWASVPELICRLKTVYTVWLNSLEQLDYDMCFCHC